MRAAFAKMLVCAVALAAVWQVFTVDTVRADPPVVDTESDVVVCPPFNLFNPDGGPGVNGLIQGTDFCKIGYRTFKAETEDATAFYVCGLRGCSRANYATVGLKRCSTCTNGSAFDMDSARVNRCISGVADAGVPLKLHCGR